MSTDDRPYRLVVSIIRGTAAGRALQLMYSGMQCSEATAEDGLALYDQYMSAAAAVLDHLDPGTCFGLVAVVNVDTGKVVTIGSLMSGLDSVWDESPTPEEVQREFEEALARRRRMGGK